MVPHLTTALIGPLLDLEKRIINAQPAIEHWFRAQWQEHRVPIYASVDLRNSGFKLAPVDTNLFPGGFNNLNPDFLPLCVLATQSAIEKICPDARGVLLIPENHTRNMFYLQNVAQIVTMLRSAGVTVRVGSLLPEITQPTVIELPNGGALTLEPIVRKDNRLFLANFNPCVILLNNDLSAGVPEILKNLDQEVIPPLVAGWTTRRKSAHFAAYDHVTNDFADLVGIDPWLINPYFGQCGKVNFQQRSGEDCLASEVDKILQKIATKYEEYGVREKPFVIVKADAGTYGMGIMTVKDASEVRDLNRKQRNKMAVVKEGLEVSDVLVQEGVYTFESINDAVAEPVVYMVDHFVVGGFYRVHTGRGVDENLNAPGMHFVPLAFESSCTLPNPDSAPNDTPNRFYSYGVIARLALLAASIELDAMQK
ncbi:MAG: glutamate--cysteine ligase [Gallionellales bacterium 35-53-114]|jgi:glutamate--cysteine ligase|nr:MAG: glutamate--cysteine ligase [Gallionellales bacterium 35-53-114]OYZ63530.1 MAG: glutamate--cysteine ligase [Gallionellales bacterium 24-53-125]OZB10860.1 MAG: glutamate--cysteine ligase [Gallionellales bacterium 39-52-133]HQS58965.1 glutamate--cysteine ligase [Gallionellaceae bacterium]HQS75650.1 glutamate--cysteine ligase [Gallionellaceae bacterium]